eukprot:TRINITY_DN34663_c0_g1_i1.p1 TRINITY_DN34663_c0_g1~~TRINITY_DN34663_c0_g1_i1.p1  ORF type:complete len:329 (+),score=55.83 TRINITY_DN34663_c0_g1_i1:174-1160(+)
MGQSAPNNCTCCSRQEPTEFRAAPSPRPAEDAVTPLERQVIPGSAAPDTQVCKPVVPLASTEPSAGKASTELSGGQAKAETSTSKRPPTLSDLPAVKAAPFPLRPANCKLSEQAWVKVKELFDSIDSDHSNCLTQAEAKEFFRQGAFSRVSAVAMFNEVDVDSSGGITGEEFASFWVQVVSSGYNEEDVLTEIDEMLHGGAWVDWKDSRDVGGSAVLTFPKRPMFDKLSSKIWNKCEELFQKIDKDGKLRITPDKAREFFQGSFEKISTDAMFSEVDLEGAFLITPAKWMSFWSQVKANGHKDKEILEELDMLLKGGAWRDWNDGRMT